MKYYHDIDLRGHHLLNAALHPTEALPENPVIGQVCVYHGNLRWWDGSTWKSAGALGTLRGGFDATLPGFPSGAAKGDYWYVKKGGDVDGLLTEPLSAGDIIIALDGALPGDENTWVLIRMNRQQATEAEPGIMRLASINLVRQGEDHNRAVTPYSLAGMKATEAEALDANEQKRFLTPHALHKVMATTERKGLIRIATQEEVEQGEVSDAAVTPKSLPAYIGEQPDRQDITTKPLTQIILLCPLGNKYAVRVSDTGGLYTEHLTG